MYTLFMASYCCALDMLVFDSNHAAAGTVQEPPGSARGAGARMSGASAWTQPPLSARQPSARNASMPDMPAATGGSNKNVKSGGAQKKTLTVSKTSKANARFSQAVPAGVDIMTDDLRGYVLECACPHLRPLIYVL